jgi:DNA-binding LacI/PurR family transcriptional regulator
VATVNPTGSSALPTLDEVARVAGVSRATASRAVNGGPKVSESARRAVEEAVRTLGYVPNRAARALVTRRTDSVAVVVPEPDDRVFNDPFFASTLRAVTRVLGEREMQLVLLLARPGAEETRMLRYLSNRHVDGALVVSHHRDDRLAELLPEIGLPCVFGGRPWTGSDRVPYVDVDNVAGGRDATEHLVRRGCRRIGTIAGPADMTAAIDRLTGWHDALLAAGLPSDAVVHGDFTEEGGRRAAEELFERHPHLDGLVVASDLMARSALAVARSRGLRVPDDLAVVGYDDLGVAETTDPPLTTMKNPITEMAARATQLLLDRIDGRETGGPYRLIIPSQLVVRASA